MSRIPLPFLWGKVRTVKMTKSRESAIKLKTVIFHIELHVVKGHTVVNTDEKIDLCFRGSI